MNTVGQLSTTVLWGFSLSLVLAQQLGAGDATRGPKNLFFAFDNGVGRGQWSPQQQADVLKELGYAGIGYTGTDDLPERLRTFKSRGLGVFSLYVHCYPGREEAYPRELVEAMKQLEGTGTMLWLTVQGQTTDEQAAGVLRELGDAAARHGVRIALYPHFGFYVATTEDAVRLVKLADRKNVGVSINLCHELRSGNAARLRDIVKAAASRLFLVSINGADREGGWDKLIQPLDRGEFDLRSFLTQLRDVGYAGPIGLQCYNVKGDLKENLTRSMNAWRELSPSLDPQQKGHTP
ncbi:MAG: sugar phosphate isomerase/epimerase [Sedimentisphaerales bacterium]|nr:sugar phosphate isomerase/epimerase [Sedimentisphaerales bacterium]